MDVKTASSAIQAILSTCDDKTKEIVLNSLKPVQTNFKPKSMMRTVSLMDAKEDLIQNHFKF